MQLEEYQNIFNLEDTHWWYKSLHGVVINFIFNSIRKNYSSGVLLDAGCGTGGMLEVIQKEFPSWNLMGIDISYNALSYTKKRNIKNLLQGSIENLPFNDESADIIISLDVLYHLQVGDDEKSLAEIYRILKKDGYLILHLPAFEFLRGVHDEIVQTRRRYTKSQLYRKVEKAGFKIVKSTYRYIFLFPVLLFRRIVDKRLNTRFKSDLRAMPKMINNLLKVISSCENRFINYFDLPFGSSLLIFST